jgi:hypothetical protein
MGLNPPKILHQHLERNIRKEKYSLRNTPTLPTTYTCGHGSRRRSKHARNPKLIIHPTEDRNFNAEQVSCSCAIMPFAGCALLSLRHMPQHATVRSRAIQSLQLRRTSMELTHCCPLLVCMLQLANCPSPVLVPCHRLHW